MIADRCWAGVSNWSKDVKEERNMNWRRKREKNDDNDLQDWAVCWEQVSKAYNFLSVTSPGSFYELKPRLTRREGEGKRNSSRGEITGRRRAEATLMKRTIKLVKLRLRGLYPVWRTGDPNKGRLLWPMLILLPGSSLHWVKKINFFE